MSRFAAGWMQEMERLGYRNLSTFDTYAEEGFRLVVSGLMRLPE
jgi:hypothetical protein